LLENDPQPLKRNFPGGGEQLMQGGRWGKIGETGRGCSDARGKRTTRVKGRASMELKSFVKQESEGSQRRGVEKKKFGGSPGNQI